ncbi:redoxin domain-containing protein [Methanoregula sp.]|uniref:redoxin domain-containing protein n=1 Tax=Methanoregula sp. TaxID=2052170 RepID=UPI002C5F8203|nr:redoxin domain-containing protein [Methanoregula sp.]HVP96096.1 redoxin domain-containing protein [Methanoregula sp.]
MEKRTLALIVALILIAAVIIVLTPLSPNRSFTGTAVAPGNRTAINAEKAKLYPYAKEIAEPSGFVNVDNITIASLVGKDVILVDFWTYSCINCERTIPYLNLWYEEYHDQGLEIIGVHTPEFQFEHDIDNVRMAVQKFGIQYPVVLDNNYATWDSYGNKYWPEDYLIDIDGFIVYHHIGEGNYNETEAEIQDLLRERAGALGLNISISNATSVPSNAVAVNFSDVGSPETYFGAARNQYLANGNASVTGLQMLAIPPQVQLNGLYLSGTWNFADQYAENTGTASIVFPYDAKNVYFVASAKNATAVQVLLDGKPVTDMAGPDVTNGTVTIQADRLYSLVQGSGYGLHTLELDIPEPGLNAYTFTFG